MKIETKDGNYYISEAQLQLLAQSEKEQTYSLIIDEFVGVYRSTTTVILAENSKTDSETNVVEEWSSIDGFTYYPILNYKELLNTIKKINTFKGGKC